MAEITISADDFQKFREYFYRKTGIQFEETKRYFVDRRLVERIVATASQNFRVYFTMLRFQASGAELQTLINAMTINETYFFREEYQFVCLVNSVLPEIIAHRKDKAPIRIWIIPSSSGEEPYSIAMCLLERWAGIRNWDVELLSSDIDTKILDLARAGRYSARSVQYVPKAYLKKYFEPIAADFQLSDEVRGAVTFSRVNLQETGDVRPFRNIDVIFCRNLLIYFDDLSRKQAAEAFYDALRPGGFICLGHSESMSRISSLFKIRKFPEAIIYQKPGEGNEAYSDHR